jgi:hypothetical protein
LKAGELIDILFTADPILSDLFVKLLRAINKNVEEYMSFEKSDL